MSFSQTTELQAFHQFIGSKLTNGSAALSPEEALEEWRQDHLDPEIDED